MLLDPARRGNEIDRVVVVLLDSRRDGEDVRIDDDIFGRKTDLVDEQIVASLRNPGLALERVRLSFLVERHDDDSGSVAAHQPRLMQERRFAFLERDRVDDRLPLHAFQSGFDHVPFRRVDHYRDARDVGLGSDEIQEARHCRFRIEHRLVHVDVDQLRAVLHLRACDFDCADEIAGEDQPRKDFGARNVRICRDAWGPETSYLPAGSVVRPSG